MTRKDTRNLLRFSRLQRVDNAEVLEALRQLQHQPEQPLEGSNPGAVRWARFVRGDIDERTFVADLRRLVLRATVLFGLLNFALLLPFYLSVSAADWRVVGVLAVSMGVGAAVWGLMMYGLVQRRVRRALKLRAVLQRGAPRPLEPRDGQCPTCGTPGNRERSVPWPAAWHWRLNPGLLVNETVLGQRTPLWRHDCAACGSAFSGCPHCGRSLDPLTWPGRNFGNWGGLRCPHCAGEIPALRNWLSLALEAPVRWLVGGR